MKTDPSPSTQPNVSMTHGGSTTTRVRDRGNRSFVICLGAALALNLLALGVFAAVSTRWETLPGGGTQISWITAMTVEATAAADEQGLPDTSAMAFEAQPRSANPERPPAQVSAPVSQAPPSYPAEVGETTRFYSFGEVDRAAEPETDSDWNLDPAALDAFGLQALVFDIFISRTGEVVDCRIIEPQSLPGEARVALENRLKQAVVRPALRHDIPVASVRRIEMAVAAQGS